MKDRITRAKEFAKKHRFVIVYTVGAVSGAAAMHKLMSNVDRDLWLSVSPDKLQKLIDNPQGALRWERPGTTIHLISEMHSQF